MPRNNGCHTMDPKTHECRSSKPGFVRSRLKYRYDPTKSKLLDKRQRNSENARNPRYRDTDSPGRLLPRTYAAPASKFVLWLVFCHSFAENTSVHEFCNK